MNLPKTILANNNLPKIDMYSLIILLYLMIIKNQRGTIVIKVKLSQFAIASCLLAVMTTVNAKDIIHDAEYYVLKNQNGKKWDKEDKDIQEKLAALREKYGTPPNIVHVMWDDTPVGEIGIPEIQILRGLKTPNINKLAGEGINFMRMYTEPSCTPSRAAVMTGRHAIRNGMFNVGFPYEYGGLAASEVTMAEVLGEVGYATGFFGKWHMGDVEESYANKQGFDEAYWTPYNQVPSMYLPPFEHSGVISATTMNPDLFPENPYELDKEWRPNGLVWWLEGDKGGAVREYLPPKDMKNWYKSKDQEELRTLAFIEKNAKAKKPFYVAFWPSGSFVPKPGKKQTLAGGILPEVLADVDQMTGRLIAKLKELGIEKNTLVILMADNGPMTHNGPPGFVETLYRGGKGDFLEGGVRVPAMAWWPGVIEPGQIVGDIIHETDLFTTFATIAGATEHIPTDRIIDGIDQTSLLLNGDTHSRRDFVHIYTGPVYAATVKTHFKRHWVGEQPGLSGAAFFDLNNDPREDQPKMLPMFPTKGMFAMMRARHEIWKEKYPDVHEARGMPFTGIENARPETLKASKLRFNKDEVPFDVEAVINRSAKYKEFDMEASWGVK